MDSQTKSCQNCKKDFVIDPDDFAFYEKIGVLVPRFCPDCRFKRLAVWRNEMSLYSGKKCDLCGKNIVTMYNPKLPHKVYCYECYISDSWDPKSYSKEYDFTKPFFEQLDNLFRQVPKKKHFH